MASCQQPFAEKLEVYTNLFMLFLASGRSTMSGPQSTGINHVSAQKTSGAAWDVQPPDGNRLATRRERQLTPVFTHAIWPKWVKRYCPSHVQLCYTPFTLIRKKKIWELTLSKTNPFASLVIHRALIFILMTNCLKSIPVLLLVPDHGVITHYWGNRLVLCIQQAARVRRWRDCFSHLPVVKFLHIKYLTLK